MRSSREQVRTADTPHASSAAMSAMHATTAAAARMQPNQAFSCVLTLAQRSAASAAHALCRRSVHARCCRAGHPAGGTAAVQVQSDPHTSNPSRLTPSICNMGVRLRQRRPTGTAIQSMCPIAGKRTSQKAPSPLLRTFMSWHSRQAAATWRRWLGSRSITLTATSCGKGEDGQAAEGDGCGCLDQAAC